MTDSRVYYLQKLDNPPHYYSGQELHTIEYNRGWVEYLLDTSDVYYSAGLTREQYQKFLPVAVDFIINYYTHGDYRIISLLKHLAQSRLTAPFELPLFSDLRQGQSFSCGSTRFTASVLCGVDPEQIPVIFQTEKNIADHRVGQAIPVTSTAQLNQLADLAHKEFSLSFSQESHPQVLSSILRNTIHEGDPERNTFQEDGIDIFKFWQRYQENGRIKLTVSCSPHTRSLISFDPLVWDVTFVDYQHQGFNFGEILSKFGEKGPGQLNLYVYNITESFHLEYLIPWTNSNTVWYHTLNKKVHLFDTSRGSSSACWPIVAIGNFVK
jgi:hypothetical protein